MNKENKKVLIELICREQTNMIVEDCSLYDSDRYRQLEEIKVEIKELEEEG